MGPSAAAFRQIIGPMMATTIHLAFVQKDIPMLAQGPL